MDEPTLPCPYCGHRTLRWTEVPVTCANPRCDSNHPPKEQPTPTYTPDQYLRQRCPECRAGKCTNCTEKTMEPGSEAWVDCSCSVLGHSQEPGYL